MKMRYLSILSLGFFISSRAVFERRDFAVRLVDYFGCNAQLKTAFLSGKTNFDLSTPGRFKERSWFYGLTFSDRFLLYVKRSDFPLRAFLKVFRGADASISIMRDVVFGDAHKKALTMSNKEFIDYLLYLFFHSLDKNTEQAQNFLYSLYHSHESANIDFNSFNNALLGRTPDLRRFLDTIFSNFMKKSGPLKGQCNIDFVNFLKAIVDLVIVVPGERIEDVFWNILNKNAEVGDVAYFEIIFNIVADSIKKYEKSKTMPETEFDTAKKLLISYFQHVYFINSDEVAMLHALREKAFMKHQATNGGVLKTTAVLVHFLEGYLNYQYRIPPVDAHMFYLSQEFDPVAFITYIGSLQHIRSNGDPELHNCLLKEWPAVREKIKGLSDFFLTLFTECINDAILIQDSGKDPSVSLQNARIVLGCIFTLSNELIIQFCFDEPYFANVFTLIRQLSESDLDEVISSVVKFGRIRSLYALAFLVTKLIAKDSDPFHLALYSLFFMTDSYVSAARFIFDTNSINKTYELQNLGDNRSYYALQNLSDNLAYSNFRSGFYIGAEKYAQCLLRELMVAKNNELYLLSILNQISVVLNFECFELGGFIQDPYLLNLLPSLSPPSSLYSIAETLGREWIRAIHIDSPEGDWSEYSGWLLNVVVANNPHAPTPDMTVRSPLDV
jgi:hypothetical protein